MQSIATQLALIKCYNQNFGIRFMRNTVPKFLLRITQGKLKEALVTQLGILSCSFESAFSIFVVSAGEKGFLSMETVNVMKLKCYTTKVKPKSHACAPCCSPVQRGLFLKQILNSKPHLGAISGWQKFLALGDLR